MASSNRKANISLTVKERILVHLLPYSRSLDRFHAPKEVTQEGIADGVGIRLNHVPRATKLMLKEEDISQEMGRVSGVSRRRKVYFLTEAGTMKAIKLRDGLLDLDVELIGKDGQVEAAKVSQVMERLDSSTQVLEVIDHMSSEGAFDMASFRGKKPVREGQVVEFCPNLPRLPEPFIGRDKVMEELSAWLEAEEPKLITIFGIEGVGKTSVALGLFKTVHSFIIRMFHLFTRNSILIYSIL